MMETSSTAESLSRRFPLVKLTQAQAEEKRIYLFFPVQYLAQVLNQALSWISVVFSGRLLPSDKNGRLKFRLPFFEFVTKPRELSCLCMCSDRAEKKDDPSARVMLALYP